MSEERKGLLSEEGEQLVAQLLDEAIPFKNPILEAFDRQAFGVIVTVVDNNLIDKIPQEWQNPLEPIVDAALDKNWNLVSQLAATLANEKIDVPGLDELSEQMIFSAVAQLIAGLLQGKAEQELKDAA